MTESECFFDLVAIKRRLLINNEYSSISLTEQEELNTSGISFNWWGAHYTNKSDSDEELPNSKYNIYTSITLDIYTEKSPKIILPFKDVHVDDKDQLTYNSKQSFYLYRYFIHHWLNQYDRKLKQDQLNNEKIDNYIMTRSTCKKRVKNDDSNLIPYHNDPTIILRRNKLGQCSICQHFVYQTYNNALCFIKTYCCKQYFHIECIFEYLQQKKSFCPLCRESWENIDKDEMNNGDFVIEFKRNCDIFNPKPIVLYCDNITDQCAYKETMIHMIPSKCPYATILPMLHKQNEACFRVRCAHCLGSYDSPGGSVLECKYCGNDKSMNIEYCCECKENINYRPNIDTMLSCTKCKIGHLKPKKCNVCQMHEDVDNDDIHVHQGSWYIAVRIYNEKESSIYIQLPICKHGNKTLLCLLVCFLRKQDLIVNLGNQFYEEPNIYFEKLYWEMNDIINLYLPQHVDDLDKLKTLLHI